MTATRDGAAVVRLATNESSDQPFDDSLQHLLAELERIDLRVRSLVAHLRRVHTEDEHFRGLYISELEVDALLARPTGAPQWLKAVDAGRAGDVDRALVDLAASLARRCRASRDIGTGLRLERLAELFELDTFEVDALLIALAVEIDLRYEKLYAYLQDDVTKKRPSIDLVLQLLIAPPADRIEARGHFLPGAPLFVHRVLRLTDDASQPEAPLIARYLKVDERVVGYLVGRDDVDERLRGFVTLIRPERSLDDLLLATPTRDALRGAASVAVTPPYPLMTITGAAGAGKRSAAEALCRERGLTMLHVDLAAVPLDLDAGHAVWLIEREAKLQGAAICWRAVEADDTSPDLPRPENATPPPRLSRSALLRTIDRGAVPTFWLAEAAGDIRLGLPTRGAMTIRLPVPSSEERSLSWARELAADGIGPTIDPAVDLDVFAARFRLTLGKVVESAATARRLARLRQSDTIGIDDLHDASRLHSNQKLNALARKATHRYRWSDIVLPPDRMAQLREICNHVRYRDRVYSDWGFGAKLAMGKGVAALFAGPSGTGKTMSASIIASELGLDLYRIDISTVVSKYIGETEKNLSKVFDEAETSNAVLFFDEADALFGKRSEVRDSHDRYANMEVGYLLQRIEEYEGIAILATNFRKNMDDAFVRRLHFTIEFPFPDSADRLRLWQAMWPADTPLDPKLDLTLLAEHFEMTGSNIRNIAVAAAFLAADDDQVVRQKHIIVAMQREYQKTGKLLGDFDIFSEH